MGAARRSLDSDFDEKANPERVDILTIILPKANRANLVITTRGQGDVITARALLLRRRGTGLMPP